MNTAELIERTRDVLASDQTITTWCEQNFGRKHKVYVDVDEEKPPDPTTDYPAIVITNIRQSRGESVREITWELEFGVALVQASKEEAENSVTFTGFLQVETLRELAEDALYRAKIASINSNSETGSISAYPLFISGSVIPITQLKSNRHGMPV